ncbi:efflux RND transporter periplasmic adaptor subunit [Jiella sonneratiae]|uniref:Efflux RND transporter periplasmic adaptor subunit n=1 Tax=Jiella sonneratiae TaxID=2816856 RepID=A0ABS3J7K5_9HYPH|nr:efflux RND transporter periplasmic adaptor subunit [Jiella sonneratiae]MBO0904571.1 efflux RND transporter periplasmic adaptor subunit [Jiella sonneratiae]
MKLPAIRWKPTCVLVLTACLVVAGAIRMPERHTGSEDAASAASAAAPDAASDQPASLTVTTDTVRHDTIGRTIVGNGVVAAHREVTIGAEATGLALTDVLVAQGDRVEKGQVIARLDGSLLKAQIAEQDAAIDSAEATLANAVSTSDRSQRLMKSGTVSRETAESNATSVATAKAALAEAEAARKTLEVQLARTEIRAPFAGVVSARPSVPGIIVQASTEIARIQEDGALEARVDVPEAAVSSLEAGASAEITAPDGRTIAAKLASLDEVVDSDTHLALAVVPLPDGSGLRAGMFVTAKIEAGGADSLTVADRALTWQEGKTAVFRVGADDTVAAIPVAVGARSDGRVAVAGDLAAGDRVVTSGAGFLQDGNRVRLVTEQASAEATGQKEGGQ